jgi:hypothetical protein
LILDCHRITSLTRGKFTIAVAWQAAFNFSKQLSIEPRTVQYAWKPSCSRENASHFTFHIEWFKIVPTEPTHSVWDSFHGMLASRLPNSNSW